MNKFSANFFACGNVFGGEEKTLKLINKKAIKIRYIEANYIEIDLVWIIEAIGVNRLVFYQLKN